MIHKLLFHPGNITGLRPIKREPHQDSCFLLANNPLAITARKTTNAIMTTPTTNCSLAGVMGIGVAVGDDVGLRGVDVILEAAAAALGVFVVCTASGVSVGNGDGVSGTPACMTIFSPG